MRAVPLWRWNNEDTDVDEAGAACDLQTTTDRPKAARLLKIYVAGLSYVGVGRDATPPTPTEDNTVYQEAETEEVYTIDGNNRFPLYLYVYAVSTSVAHAVRVSAFG